MFSAPLNTRKWFLDLREVGWDGADWMDMAQEVSK
jgi:hypothetical protein